MAQATNFHATCLIIGDSGVLLTGASGSGKSSLAFWLIHQARHKGIFARLVSDDQVYLQRAHGRVMATAPDTIAGQLEIRGSGIIAVENESWCIVDLVVHLEKPDDEKRLPSASDRITMISGVELPLLTLASNEPAKSGALVLEALKGFQYLADS